MTAATNSVSSLPPCGGGLGRGVAASPELAVTPLPVPPPQGAREPDGKGGGRQRHKQFRRDKRDVHGWVVLDKPIGMTSTHAVALIRRLFTAKRAGHAAEQDRAEQRDHQGARQRAHEVHHRGRGAPEEPVRKGDIAHALRLAGGASVCRCAGASLAAAVRFSGRDARAGRGRYWRHGR